MTTTPTPAPASVPDEYILKTNRLFVSVEQFDGEVGLTVVREWAALTPDQADALADAIKEHAAAARERQHHE